MNFVLHPLYLLLVSLVMVFLVCEECYQRGVLSKAKLTMSLVNVFIVAMFWIFSNNLQRFIGDYKGYSIFGWIYIVYSIGVYVFLVVLIGFVASFSYQKANSYSNFINSLNESAWSIYMICDKKDRIKEISDGFLVDLGLNKKEVIGKKAFDVFDSTIRFIKMDDIDVTNAELRSYYKNFSKTSKDKEEYKRELFFKNCNGSTVVINFVEKAIFINKRYRGRMIVGQKKNDLSLMNVEKELVARNKELEAIQYKFIASLELMDEAIFFNDLDENYIWGNDNYVRDLHLSSNTVSTMDYRNLILDDDRDIYARTIANLTTDNPTYKLTYRIMIGSNVKFIEETGKRIFDDENSNVILGFAKVLSNNYFQHTDFPIIDEIKSKDDLINDLGHLYEDKRIFELVCIHLTSLPDINDQYGREVGNMVMSEYIKKLKENFVTESGDMYRTTGLTFYLTITDARKMDFFKKGLQSSNNAMNMRAKYGNMIIEMNVHIGVADAFDDGNNKDELLKACNKSINTALNPNYRLNYAYYKDLKDFSL